jgi:NAD(P)H-dependent FMN reductase
MSKIGIIIGSSRPNRFGPEIANWINNLAQSHKGAEFELVDVAEYNLPLLDEPELPAMGNYKNEHTKKWASKIAEFDGFIFVVPEYNHGMAASTKNAIDFLYAEWLYKPVAYVSYGAVVGGSRAVEQLRLVAAQLKQYDILEQVVIAKTWEHKDEQGKFIPNEDHKKEAQSLLDSIVFWTEEFKPIRAKLTK